MVNVRFYGSLKQFGSEFKLDAKNTAEIVRALTSQIPKLREFIQNGYFKVRLGNDYIDNRYIEKGMYYNLKEGMTVHFTPVLKGSKKFGVFQAILGVAVIAFSFWNPLGWAAATAKMGMILGASLALGGVAQMLMKPPEMPGLGKDKEKNQSTSFSNLSNIVAQGHMVPLAYGRILTGSMIISQGVETIDVEVMKEKAKKQSGFGKGRI